MAVAPHRDTSRQHSPSPCLPPSGSHLSLPVEPPEYQGTVVAHRLESIRILSDSDQSLAIRPSHVPIFPAHHPDEGCPTRTLGPTDSTVSPRLRPNEADSPAIQVLVSSLPASPCCECLPVCDSTPPSHYASILSAITPLYLPGTISISSPISFPSPLDLVSMQSRPQGTGNPPT